MSAVQRCLSRQCYILGLHQISEVQLEGDPWSQGDGHEVRDSASARALCPLHFLVPRFGVGQVGLNRLRPVTQRVRVGMKPGVGHESPEGVDQSLGGCAPLQ